MTERVRALLITPRDELLLIKRVKPGQPHYWVLPGGHREPSDATREEALRREVREELAGEADIHSLVQIVGPAGDRQYIFLCRVGTYDFAARTGPEFSQTGRGQYILDPVPLTAGGLDGIALKPPEVAEFIAPRMTSRADLWALPDLRDTRSGAPVAHSM